jgi:hypothetical protein
LPIRSPALLRLGLDLATLEPGCINAGPKRTV